MLGYYIIYVVSVVVINWRKHIKKSRIENYQSLGLPFPRCEFDSDSEGNFNLISIIIILLLIVK